MLYLSENFTVYESILQANEEVRFILNDLSNHLGVNLFYTLDGKFANDLASL